LWSFLSLSLSPVLSTGLSLLLHRRPWWLEASGRGASIFLVVGLLLHSFFRQIIGCLDLDLHQPFSQSLLSQAVGNKVGGWSWVGVGSYARTLLPDPRRPASSAPAAPTFPPLLISFNKVGVLSFCGLVHPGRLGGGRREAVQDLDGIPTGCVGPVLG
jgi:hypothetical protein